MAINALGQLALLAAESNDFKMVQGRETKYLNYEYFQANLMQVNSLITMLELQGHWVLGYYRF